MHTFVVSVSSATRSSGIRSTDDVERVAAEQTTHTSFAFDGIDAPLHAEEKQQDRFESDCRENGSSAFKTRLEIYGVAIQRRPAIHRMTSTRKRDIGPHSVV